MEVRIYLRRVLRVCGVGVKGKEGFVSVKFRVIWLRFLEGYVSYVGESGGFL